MKPALRPGPGDSVWLFCPLLACRAGTLDPVLDLSPAWTRPEHCSRKSLLRALISVSDTTGIVDLADALHDLGVGLLSTGGPATLLA